MVTIRNMDMMALSTGRDDDCPLHDESEQLAKEI